MRVQLELSDQQVKHLESLMKETRISTKKDLFNYALTLFEWAVNEKKDGKLIVAFDPHEERYKEMVMPPLLAVAQPQHWDEEPDHETQIVPSGRIPAHTS
jgi:hypothetical protein